MALLAGILLSNLQFDSFVGVVQGGDQRRHRLAHLEVDGAVLDLYDYVVVELAVERMKIIVRSFCSIVLRFTPVEVMVVDKSSIKNQTSMCSDRPGQCVGGIRRSSPIGSRTGATFRVRFDYETAEVWNQPVDFIGLVAPPFAHARICGIKRAQAANHFGTADIDGDGQLHAPGSECVGDARELRKK